MATDHTAQNDARRMTPEEGALWYRTAIVTDLVPMVAEWQARLATRENRVQACERTMDAVASLLVTLATQAEAIAREDGHDLAEVRAYSAALLAATTGAICPAGRPRSN